ncbi:MAG: methionyl-tRNA formyltransferase [Candidatus Ancillula sp.]|nr:methionyl-tRNA formyltransferase [Candidatus Ancillula sp.]
MKLLFAGTPEVAVPSLKVLAERHEIVAVLTTPDAPKGRGKQLSPSPIKQAALALGLPVVENVEEIYALPQKPDLGVVVAYGKLLKPQELDYFEHGWINLHFSLLPKFRGASPVQSAILTGTLSTGMTVFRLAPGLDDGPVIASTPYQIGESETTDEVFSAMARQGAELLHTVVEEIRLGKAIFEPQDAENATYTRKLLKSEARLDWTLSAEVLARKINAFSSNPGAWFEVEADGKPAQRVVALKALAGETDGGAGVVVPAGASGEDRVVLLMVKPAGKNAMPAKDWERGLHGEFKIQ